MTDETTTTTRELLGRLEAAERQLAIYAAVPRRPCSSLAAAFMVALVPLSLLGANTFGDLDPG